MSFKDFLHITPKEFYLSLKSKNIHDGILIESNVKFICNTIRLQTFYLMNIQLEKKDTVREPEKLMTFPWDSKTLKRQTKAQMIKMMKMMAAVTKNDKKKKPNE